MLPINRSIRAQWGLLKSNPYDNAKAESFMNPDF
jgi:hypothetical protein